MAASPVLLAPTSGVAPAAPRDWLWAQSWHDLFFAHWRVPVASVEAHLPRGLEVETWDGAAWISVVAFRLKVRRRWLPPLPGTRFVELNLRTYVRQGRDSGIYFLSIHAGKRIGVALARWLTPLPYVFAPIRYERHGQIWCFECRRADGSMGLLEANFTPLEPASTPADTWLLERYRAFAADRRGRLWRMWAQHLPWQVCRVEAHVLTNHLGMPWGLALNREPDAVHFAPEMTARLGRFERC
jgi:uncharacterized protein YqjF (DUF2071 family)